MKTIIFTGSITVIFISACISVMILLLLLKKINQNMYKELTKASEDIVNALVELFTGEKIEADDSLMAYIAQKNSSH